RKSLPDLIGSLRSGRLFNQAGAMTRHYACAALLVEFEVNASFSLQAIGGLSDAISPAAVTSQLAMLALAFPRLRVLWSCSPYETVSIFAELKQGRGEPDADRAVAVGQDDAAVERDSLYSAAPVALLQSLPGVTPKNYQALARRFRGMRELCAADRSDLEQLLGAGPAAQLHGFLHQAS
ncbi:DNA repair endonuclease XPF, partial [Coemansia erecta]